MRRFLIAVSGLLAALCMSTVAARAADAVGYLESLRGKATPFLAPSDIDPRYTTALYVNTSGSGPNKQRMWVLHRDAIGGAWRLAMWDKDYWKKAKLGDGEVPAFSWLVSTGRGYPGDRKSGPTPNGVFALDERKRRYGWGWLQDGMVHVMHIDFHYPDGRMSGVAFHGTTEGRYRRLGSIDSHGCIRMKQKNALDLLNRVTGKDGVLAEDLRWGEVPRFWAAEKGTRRTGYTRDGSAPMSLPPPAVKIAPGATTEVTTPPSTPIATPEDPMTKTGFRAIAIMFQD